METKGPTTSTSTTSGFQFPWYYNNPPFFTAQPVLETQKKQLAMWVELVLSWTQHTKVYQIDSADAVKSPLFHNAGINRKASPELVQCVLNELVERGNGEWLNKEKTKLTVFWKSPQQWAALIYKWVGDLGMIGRVMTLYEIRQGEEAEGQEFYELDPAVLLKALKVLEKEGKAQLFSGKQTEEMGVKFF